MWLCNGYSVFLVTSVHFCTAHCAMKINSIPVKGRWAGVTRHWALSYFAQLGLENIALYSRLIFWDSRQFSVCMDRCSLAENPKLINELVWKAVGRTLEKELINGTNPFVCVCVCVHRSSLCWPYKAQGKVNTAHRCNASCLCVHKYMIEHVQHAFHMLAQISNG